MASESALELLVHVGLPKTGSTAIQLYMHRAREALAAHGVYWAETYRTGTDEPLNDCAHHVYSHRWGGWLDPAKFSVTPAAAWQSLRESIRMKGGRHIVSSERFGDLLGMPEGEDLLKFVKEIAGPARVRLVAYVRRQDDFIESHFRELIKSWQLSTLEDYLARDDLYFFYYDRMFAQAAEFLGKENVIVRIYGRKQLYGGDAVSDFLHACDIPAPIARYDESAIVNPSLNTLTAKLLSDPRIVRKLTETPLYASYVRDFFSQEKYSHFDRHVLLDTDARRAIMQRFEAGNDRLAKMFLSEADAQALRFDEVERTRIPREEFVLFHDDVVDLVLALQPRR